MKNSILIPYELSAHNYSNRFPFFLFVYCMLNQSQINLENFSIGIIQSYVDKCFTTQLLHARIRYDTVPHTIISRAYDQRYTFKCGNNDNSRPQRDKVCPYYLPQTTPSPHSTPSIEEKTKNRPGQFE